MPKAKPTQQVQPFSSLTDQSLNTKQDTSSVGTVDTQTTGSTQGTNWGTQFGQQFGGQTGENAISYGTYGISDTPEARQLMAIDLGIDPGVGRRTDLAEQANENRWNNSLQAGIPSFIRNSLRDASARDIASQGAAAAQQAQYGKNQLEFARAGMLLPQILQSGSKQLGTQYGQQFGGQMGGNQQTQEGRTMGRTTENTSSTGQQWGQTYGRGHTTAAFAPGGGSFASFLGGLGQGLGSFI